MKIGILTFIKTINYGALFQAFALQYVLERLGYKTELLQYENQHIAKKEMNKNLFSAKYLIRKIIIGRGFEKKRRKFDFFEKKYIHIGAPVERGEFENKKGEYDVIVVGSDQVWNIDLTHYDLTFFLKGFVNIKRRIAYAPSFGNNLSASSLNDDILALLRKFNAISVREQSCAEILGAKMVEKPKVVLDPTLLMTKKEWSEYISFKPPYDHYILVYFPNNKKRVFEFAKKLSKKKNCQIVYLSISPRIQWGVDTIYDASPEEWLGWLYYADYVIVGSFHGTAFSLNFEKQFFYENAGPGSRIDNLVTLTNTKNRNLDFCNIDEIIDYDFVRKNLDVLRMDSLTWLRNAVENG